MGRLTSILQREIRLERGEETEIAVTHMSLFKILVMIWPPFNFFRVMEMALEMFMCLLLVFPAQRVRAS